MSFARIWAAPVALGVLTASGLVSALVADGWGDAWSWVALGVPLVVMARFAFRRGAPHSSSSSSTRTRP